MDQISALIDSFEFQEAKTQCEAILKTDPNCFEALSTLAALNLELGNPEASREALLKCHTLCEGRSWETCMNLGQLAEGEEALSWYQKGINLLRQEQNNLLCHENSSKSQEIATALSTALASLAEIWMTDLCEREEAEEMCLKAVQEALQIQPLNPEALVTAASLAICRQQPEAEIKEHLNKFFDLLGKAEAEEYAASLECRINAVRLALEVGLLDDALAELEKIALMNEEVVDVFYLMAVAWKLKGGAGSQEKAIEALNEAKALLEALRQSGEEDCEMEEAVEALFEEIGDKEAENVHSHEIGDQEGEISNQEDWESEEEDAQMQE